MFLNAVTIILKPLFQWLSYFVYPWGSGSIWLYPCLICGENPQGTVTPVWLYTKYFLCFWLYSFDLLSFGLMNHVATSQLERLWRVNSLDVNNRSCCVLQDVCECWQACSCTNIMCRAACIASVLHECFQSIIISLWRSVPFWLCHLWDMTVFIRQDYSQYVMLWCDKNKVHGFFVFLFCCSFESYRLL